MKPNILRMAALPNVIELLDKAYLWDNVSKLVIELAGTSGGPHPLGGLMN